MDSEEKNKMAKRELHSYKGWISLTLKGLLIIFILIYDFNINQPSNSMCVIKCAKNKYLPLHSNYEVWYMT